MFFFGSPMIFSLALGSQIRGWGGGGVYSRNNRALEVQERQAERQRLRGKESNIVKEGE